MKTIPCLPTLPALLLVLFLFWLAPLQANSINIPGIDGNEIPANLCVVDTSSGTWAFLPTKLQQEDNGFVANSKSPSGSTFEIKGTFEKVGDSMKCKIKWEGAEGLDSGFIMIVPVIPVDEVSGAEVVAGSKKISIPKMLNDENVTSYISNITDFTFGPWNGHQFSFTFDAPIEVNGLVMGHKDFFHLRLRLTDKNSGIPASGEVGWTMSKATP
jgi:hypothetical protein